MSCTIVRTLYTAIRFLFEKEANMYKYVRFEVSTVFSDVLPCGSLRTDESEEYIAYIIRTTRIGELATANVVPTPSILVTLMI
jgi:hypothetical protein